MPFKRKRIQTSVITSALMCFAMLAGACAQAAEPTPSAALSPSAAPAQIETLSLPADSAETPKLNQRLPEVPVLNIPLEGPAALAQAEYSGIAWYQDELILLPQYPQRMSEQAGGVLYAINRQTLIDFIQGKSSAAIRPREIQLVSHGLERTVPQFEGFEAIAFKDQKVYLCIEAREGLRMLGYLVSGEVKPDSQTIELDLSTLTKNPLQQDQSNRSDEAILIAGDQVLTFFEANGAQANPFPYAALFDLNLRRLDNLEFPSVEYRLTDASEIDAAGRFWMINYFFPGDTDLLPSSDPIREQYGVGETHNQFPSVERLLEFQYTPQGITLVDQAPILLELDPQGESRNWEGLVRLADLGFLIITDKFPSTILGFVAYP